MIVGVLENVVEVEKGRFLFVVNLLVFGFFCRCIERWLNYKDNVIFCWVYVYVNCLVSMIVVLLFCLSMFFIYICIWLGY